MPNLQLFLLMIFCAVFLLSYLLVVPTFSGENYLRKRLNKQIDTIKQSYKPEHTLSLNRKKYLEELSPLGRKLEEFTLIHRLSKLIEQSGRKIAAHKIVLWCFFAAGICYFSTWLLSKHWLIAIAAGFIGFYLPVLKLIYDRSKRMNKFNEQLPHALDVIVRSLRVGHTFPRSLHFVGEEMNDPIASEFSMTFAEINYGYDIKTALLNLLQRIPNVSVMALVTSVLIQTETGGNLAEIVEKISAVIRSRFRLQRKIKTLSAEGRLSAWVLTMIPFVIVIFLHIMNPDYLPHLFEDPLGKKIIAGTLFAMFIGVLWMRKIIRIEL